MYLNVNVSWFHEILWPGWLLTSQILKTAGKKVLFKALKLLSQSIPLNPNCCDWYAQWPTVQTQLWRKLPGVYMSGTLAFLTATAPGHCVKRKGTLSGCLKNLKVILCNSDSTYKYFCICFAATRVKLGLPPKNCSAIREVRESELFTFTSLYLCQLLVHIFLVKHLYKRQLWISMHHRPLCLMKTMIF